MAKSRDASVQDIDRLAAALPPSVREHDVIIHLARIEVADSIKTISEFATVMPSEAVRIMFGTDSPFSPSDKPGRPNPFLELDRAGIRMDAPGTVKQVIGIMSGYYSNGTRTSQFRLARFGKSLDKLNRTLPPALRGDGPSHLSTERVKTFVESAHASENPIGVWVTDMSLNYVVDMEHAGLQSLADERATKLMLLSVAYKRRHGHLPASLRQLHASPDLLVDPFSGAPFKYSPQRKILWSVGRNYKDDGGIERSKSARADDLVWRLP